MASSLLLFGDHEADHLLSKDPLALLMGMVLDQQIPLERAFSSPGTCADASVAMLDAAGIAHGPRAVGSRLQCLARPAVVSDNRP